MANPKHVAVVRAGTPELNAWRASHRGVVLDLGGADLRRVDLSAERLPGSHVLTATQPDGTLSAGFNHRPADLTLASLTGADLAGADLTDALLSRADFSRASLRGACLARSIATEASLIDTDISWSDLGWSTFTHANLTGAKLTRSDLTGANFSYTQFRDAMLSEVHFSEVRLRGATFAGAHLSRDNFSGTDLATAAWDGTIHSQRCYVDTSTLYRTASTLTQDRAREREVESFLRRCGLEPEALELYRAQIGQPVEYYSAFISYSRADREFATALYDALQVRGVQCWLDERALLPGDELYDEINRAIRLHDKVLLCCSESSLRSWWVENEIDIVFEREQQSAREGDKCLVLIPLNVDGFLFRWNGGRAAQIRKRVAADFVSWQEQPAKFTLQVDRLAQALTARVISPL